MNEPRLILRAGRERSLMRRHPWVFSGAVASVHGDPAPGDTVRVVSVAGTTLGAGAYSPHSQIRARMWTFDADEIVDADLIARRVVSAAARRGTILTRTDAARLVFGEADALPGLVADRYGDTVVVQITAAGAERWRDVIADTFAGLDGIRSVFERSDADTREMEGLTSRVGTVRGDPPAAEIVVSEGAMRFAVDVRSGHKTGFYLDQRDSRALVGQLAPDRRVLNVFAYTGAFSVAAAMAGAGSVTSIDSSGPSLALARRNAELNGVDIGELVEADAFVALRRLRDRAQQYDLIILDPPKLAMSERHVDKASRAYKDLNLLAMKLLAPGGVLLTYSCSGAMTRELFQKVLAGAALDARREMRITGSLRQAADHPVPLSFPEAYYLKGFVLEAP